jgi:hypothetical protein
MTSLPQTRQPAHPAQDNCRTWPAGAMAGTAQTPDGARSRARQSLPAVDPSTAYGCVDWYLYPDAKPEPELRRISI